MRWMPPPPPGRAAALAASVVLAGCAGAPPERARPGEPQGAVAELPAPGFPSPARWSYHPAAPEYALAQVRLGDGGCVVVAEGGQRWLVTPAPGAGGERRGAAAAAGGQGAAPAACAGRGVASHVFAPEPLVDLVRRGPSSWLFVGVSGAIYESATPLGAFARTIAPPGPLLEVAGAGGVLLAVTRDGAVLRHDDQGSWRPVALPAATALPAAGGAATALPAAGGAATGAAATAAVAPRVFDVVVGEGGRALAIGLPEALFASEDGGKSWTRSPLPAMGLWRVSVAGGGALIAEGILSSVTWDPRQTPAFSRAPTAPSAGAEELTVDVGRTPTAGAVAFGRAAVAGDRYHEAVRPEEPGEPWVLASGPIEGPLETRPMQGTSECGSVKLGASGRNVVAVCVRALGDAIVAEVLRSHDGGGRWSSAAKLETPDVDRVGVAVSPDGAALLTGVCKPSEGTAGADPGGGECRPSAPVLIRLEGERIVATLSTASTLGALAALPAFSADGRSAYFAGYRAKDDRLALFVSHDGGETFSPRPIDRGEAAGEPARGELDDGEGDESEGEPGGTRSGSFELTEDSALRVGEDGAVGLLVGDGGAMAYVTADEDGRVLSIAAPPGQGAVMAGFGRRVLALTPYATAGRAGEGGLALWESLDGGGSWAELPEMPALSREFFSSGAGVACGAGGCLVGDTVTRVGWGGQAEALQAAPEPPQPALEPAVRTPIVCELSPAARWTRIEHVQGNAWGLPTANEAMRGRSVWSVLTHDPAHAVGTVAALLPEGGAGEARITTRALLPAEPRGARVGTHVAAQMEGYAAARVRIPGARGGEIKPGAPMRDVEIAWENWMDGTSGRGSIPDAGPFEIGDVKPAAGDLYDPELLSVSLRGIFVRPHSGSAKTALTFFLEPGGRLQRFEYPAWPAMSGARRLDVAGDAVMADGQPVGVGMLRHDGAGPVTTVLLARRPPAAGAPWGIEAVTVAPPSAQQRDLVTHTDWTYAGKSIGVTSIVADPRRSRGVATFQPFRGDGTLGPAQPLPTPFDLPDPPRPCTAAERAATARLEALLLLRGEALFPGTRHPVLVAGGAGPGSLAEPIVLLTSSVVLHGTAAAPCVAGWEANALGRLPVGAILPGDLAHAWLFRLATPPPAAPGAAASGAVAIEAHPMACRFDPTAKVPDAVWSEPATSRIAP